MISSSVSRRVFVGGLVAIPVAASAASGRQLASVNHIYVVLDQDTVSAMSASTMLAELGRFSTRSTQASEGSWTGRYLTMESCYLEFFGPNDMSGVGVGSVGIALSGDRVGTLSKLKDNLRRRGAKLQTDTMKRRLGEQEINWFDLVDVGDHSAHVEGEPAITVWGMEYDSAYLDHPEVGKPPALNLADRISRRRYNSDQYKGEPMVGLAAANFVVPSGDWTQTVRPMMDAAGFRITEHSNGALCDGDEIDLHFHFGAAKEIRLRELRLRLNRALPAERREGIGRSELVAGPGASARWTFG